MPTYKVTDPTTGKTLKLTGDSPPTEKELNEIFASVAPTAAPELATSHESTQAPTKSFTKTVAGKIAPYLPVAGSVVGGVLAAPANIVAPGVSEAIGISGGYLIGSEAKRRAEEYAGLKSPPPTLVAGLKETARDIPEAAQAGLSAPIVGKGVELVSRGGGRLVKEILGTTTGTGKGAVEEAIKGGKPFTDAMRGNISGEEVVKNAKDALRTIAEKRAIEYQGHLQNLSPNQQAINIKPISNRLNQLMTRYNVKVDPQTGTIDTSRIAMGKTGRNDIEDIITTVKDWGSKAGDNTPMGLDTLKRQLDDFYSDSSQARQFVSSLRDEVKNTIVRAVPEYGQMTKGYSEATKIIKDIESNLMIKKEGMSGRITADQTLRRLSSALRENFEMRRNLMDALTTGSGQEISSQVAGHAMSQVLPRGGLGKLFAGSEAYAAFLHPQIIPVLTTASPRVMGEFLNIYGKTARQLSKMPTYAAKYGAVAAISEGSKKEENK